MSTTDIVGQLVCHGCGATGKNNLKRGHKQSFKTILNTAGELIPETKVEWRAFICQQCGEVSHTTQMGNEVYLTEQDACLPMSAVDWWVEYDGFVGLSADSRCDIMLWVGYKEKVNDDYVAYDDVRDDNLLGVLQYLQLNGLYVCNSMENAWEVSLAQDSSTIKTDYDVIMKLKELMTAIGGKESEDLVNEEVDLEFAKTRQHKSIETLSKEWGM